MCIPLLDLTNTITISEKTVKVGVSVFRICIVAGLHTSDSTERGPDIGNMSVGEYLYKLVIVLWKLPRIIILSEVQLSPGIESCRKELHLWLLAMYVWGCSCLAAAIDAVSDWACR